MPREAAVLFKGQVIVIDAPTSSHHRAEHIGISELALIVLLVGHVHILERASKKFYIAVIVPLVSQNIHLIFTTSARTTVLTTPQNLKSTLIRILTIRAAAGIFAGL